MMVFNYDEMMNYEYYDEYTSNQKCQKIIAHHGHHTNHS